MKSRDLELVLVSKFFDFRRQVIVPNVSWGLLPWEADLLVMSGSGYLTEVELKVSLGDLKRDASKQKWRMGTEAHDPIKHRYFAMPEALAQHKDAGTLVPAGAGILSVSEPDGSRLHTARVKELRAPATNKRAKPLSDKDRFQLARLGMMRYWGRDLSQLRRDSYLDFRAERQAASKQFREQLVAGSTR